MSILEPIIDLSQVNFDQVLVDQEGLRAYNPQRHEMEQLTAIVFEDSQRHICVGFKDVTDSDFWTRGHQPGAATMPGVLVCEAAAQMCSYYVQKQKLVDTNLLGFGGMEDVEWHGTVRPGDRILIAGQIAKARARVMVVWRFQAFVAGNLICQGRIKGIPLPGQWWAHVPGASGPEAGPALG